MSVEAIQAVTATKPGETVLWKPRSSVTVAEVAVAATKTVTYV